MCGSQMFEDECAHVLSNPTHHKEYNYVDGQLVGYSVYMDESMHIKLFEVHYIIQNDLVRQRSIKRISDNVQMITYFNYYMDMPVSQNSILL